jgi:hypothetical protein
MYAIELSFTPYGFPIVYGIAYYFTLYGFPKINAQPAHLLPG